MIARFDAQGAVLEAALVKHRHVETGDSFHAARHDFTFERVEFFHAVIREGDERNAGQDLPQPGRVADQVVAHVRRD